jgi:hypothetical protein
MLTGSSPRFERSKSQWAGASSTDDEQGIAWREQRWCTAGWLTRHSTSLNHMWAVLHTRQRRCRTTGRGRAGSLASLRLQGLHAFRRVVFHATAECTHRIGRHLVGVKRPLGLASLPGSRCEGSGLTSYGCFRPSRACHPGIGHPPADLQVMIASANACPITSSSFSTGLGFT